MLPGITDGETFLKLPNHLFPPPFPPHRTLFLVSYHSSLDWNKLLIKNTHALLQRPMTHHRTQRVHNNP